MPSPRCAAQGEGEDLQILWLNGLIQLQCTPALSPSDEERVVFQARLGDSSE